MASWNEKLRQSMENYSQTPPEGLWESVEAGLPRKKAAWWPWVWGFAAAAAAVLAVVVLWRPQPASPVDILSSSEQLAEVPEILPLASLGQNDSEEQPVVAEESAVAPAILSDSEESAADDSEEQPVVAEEPAVAPVIPSDSEESAADDSEEQSVVAEEPAVAPAKRLYDAERRSARSRIRTSVGLLAGGLPGAATNSYTSYGGMFTFAAAAPGASNGAPKTTTVSLLSRNKPTETQVRHSLALRIGALANLSFNDWLGVETGLMLSNLQSQSSVTTGNINTLTDKTTSYVGVPLHIVITPLRIDRFALYTSAGPMFEYGFRSVSTVDNYIGTEQVNHDIATAKEQDPIFSLGLNIGAQWMLGDVGGLFVQPGVSWYLPGEDNNASYYTEHPLSFALSAGFRFVF